MSIIENPPTSNCSVVMNERYRGDAMSEERERRRQRYRDIYVYVDSSDVPSPSTDSETAEKMNVEENGELKQR
jgi:hypothetical protein